MPRKYCVATASYTEASHSTLITHYLDFELYFGSFKRDNLAKQFSETQKSFDNFAVNFSLYIHLLIWFHYNIISVDISQLSMFLIDLGKK